MLHHERAPDSATFTCRSPPASEQLGSRRPGELYRLIREWPIAALGCARAPARLGPTVETPRMHRKPSSAGHQPTPMPTERRRATVVALFGVVALITEVMALPPRHTGTGPMPNRLSRRLRHRRGQAAGQSRPSSAELVFFGAGGGVWAIESDGTSSAWAGPNISGRRRPAEGVHLPGGLPTVSLTRSSCSARSGIPSGSLPRSCGSPVCSVDGRSCCTASRRRR
jgi:hypothetical protein